MTTLDRYLDPEDNTPEELDEDLACPDCGDLLPSKREMARRMNVQWPVCKCACPDCGESAEYHCSCEAERAIIATLGSIPGVYRPEGWKP